MVNDRTFSSLGLTFNIIIFLLFMSKKEKKKKKSKNKNTNNKPKPSQKNPSKPNPNETQKSPCTRRAISWSFTGVSNNQHCEEAGRLGGLNSRVNRDLWPEHWCCRHHCKCSLHQVCSLQTVNLAKLLIWKLFLKQQPWGMQNCVLTAFRHF